MEKLAENKQFSGQKNDGIFHILSDLGSKGIVVSLPYLQLQRVTLNSAYSPFNHHYVEINYNQQGTEFNF